MESSSRSAPTSFFNYPTPKAHNIPYKAIEPPKNPVIKGITLHYLSYLFTTLPFLPAWIYSNAGLTGLRKLQELDFVEARYDPAVIPISKPGDGAPESYTNPDVRLLNQMCSNVAKGGFYTIVDFQNAYKSGTITPSDVIESLLPLIRRDLANRSPHSTAFVESKIDVIRQAAAESTKRWREGRAFGILDGVPFAVKDELDVAGYKRHIGTKKDFNKGREVESSWCVKMLEKEGAVMIGKTNMHELGMDTTNNNINWGTPLNPYNEEYYTGGSSGGSAYAVAAGIVPFALGSDGGGSVRLPSK